MSSREPPHDLPGLAAPRLRPELVPGVEVAKVLPTVSHPAVLELEDEATINIQVIAVSLPAVVVNADHQPVTWKHVPQSGLEACRSLCWSALLPTRWGSRPTCVGSGPPGRGGVGQRGGVLPVPRVQGDVLPHPVQRAGRRAPTLPLHVLVDCGVYGGLDVRRPLREHRDQRVRDTADLARESPSTAAFPCLPADTDPAA